MDTSLSLPTHSETKTSLVHTRFGISDHKWQMPGIKLHLCLRWCQMNHFIFNTKWITKSLKSKSQETPCYHIGLLSLDTHMKHTSLELNWRDSSTLQGQATQSVFSDLVVNPSRPAKSGLALQEPGQGKPCRKSGAKTARKGDMRAAGVKVIQTATTWATPLLTKAALYNNVCDKCLYSKEREIII